MPQADPESIQREIEQTRSSLADTVDAIADKVSPKRVTARTVAQVKEKINYTFGHDYGDGDDGPSSNASSVRWAGDGSGGARSTAVAWATSDRATYISNQVQLRKGRIAGAAVALLLIARRLRKRHKAKLAQKAFERFERWAERRDYRDDRREQWR